MWFPPGFLSPRSPPSPVIPRDSGRLAVLKGVPAAPGSASQGLREACLLGGCLADLPAQQLPIQAGGSPSGQETPHPGRRLPIWAGTAWDSLHRRMCTGGTLSAGGGELEDGKGPSPTGTTFRVGPCERRMESQNLTHDSQYECHGTTRLPNAAGRCQRRLVQSFGLFWNHMNLGHHLCSWVTEVHARIAHYKLMTKQNNSPLPPSLLPQNLVMPGCAMRKVTYAKAGRVRCDVWMTAILTAALKARSPFSAGLLRLLVQALP